MTKATKTNGGDAIRPFRVNIPQEAIDDLRRRIEATRWPEKETVADTSQGVPLAPLQDLARYWATDYDWRKCEAKLNALPQFTTEIDGLDIHFIHVRSKHKGALPVIVTHGWPGSILEQIKLVGPLTDPTAFGGRAEDAFDVVIPSIPGYGFSGKPTATGWDHARIARAWIVLMRRLGYTRYVAQGGDVGGQITDAMAVEAPAELVAMHTNFLFALPEDVSNAIQSGGPAPSDLSDLERRALDKLKGFFVKNAAYAIEMATRPQTLYGLADSPVSPRGLADRPRRRRRPAGGDGPRGDGHADQRTAPGAADAGRRARQHHPLLADKHRGLLGPQLLGQQAPVLRPQELLHPGGGHRLPRRDLPALPALGGARLLEALLLPRGGQGRALRGVGRAAALRVGDARGVQVVAVDQCRAVDGAQARASSAARHPGQRKRP